MSGCWAKRRFRMVDFPVPEGPETTIRGLPAGAGVAGAIYSDKLGLESIAQQDRWGSPIGWERTGTGRGHCYSGSNTRGKEF